MDTAATDNANRTTLDASETSATATLYRAAIGPINTDGYQRIFERFETAKRSAPHWNWGAALITLNWMAFRGLWGAALAYLGASAGAVLLLFGIGRLVFSLSPEALWAMSAVLLLLSIVIPGLWGNALFYAACRTRMAQALAANNTVPQACTMLLRGASSRKHLVVIALGNLVLLTAGLFFWLNFPPGGQLPHNTVKLNDARSMAQGPVLPVAPMPASAVSATATPSSAASATMAASAPAAEASAPMEPIAPEPIVATSALAAPMTTPAARPVTKTPAAKLPSGTKAVPSGPKFFVNAGLFANETNAKNAHEKLLAAGLTAFTQPVSGPRGTFTRVRAGPFKTQDEAVAAAMKIRSLGLDAEVFSPP